MQFQLKYNGPAVDAGRMDARELGPAILAVGTLLEQASVLMYGPDRKVNVEVRADFEHGSFGIHFDVLQLVRDAYELLGVEATRTIFEVLFGGVSVLSVSALLRRGWAQNESGTEITPADEEFLGGGASSADASMILPGTTVDTKTMRWKLLHDPEIRKSFEGIVAPVEKNPGINSVSVIVEEQELERIERSEAAAFRAPPDEDETQISEDVIPAVLQIIGISFGGKKSHVWKFALPKGQPFPAPIQDAAFLDRVRRGAIRFGMGDALKVEALVTTTRKGTELKDSWVILKVIEPLHAPQSGQTDWVEEES